MRIELRFVRENKPISNASAGAKDRLALGGGVNRMRDYAFIIGYLTGLDINHSSYAEVESETATGTTLIQWGAKSE